MSSPLTNFFKLKKRIPLHLAKLSPGSSVDLQTKTAKLKLYLFEIQTMTGVTFEFGATSIEERDSWLQTIWYVYDAAPGPITISVNRLPNVLTLRLRTRFDPFPRLIRRRFISDHPPLISPSLLPQNVVTPLLLYHGAIPLPLLPSQS